jgi:hypothetical protein
LEISVKTSVLLLALLGAPVIATPQGAGIKITTRGSSIGGIVSQNTEYFQGDRRRREYRNSSGSNYGPPLVFLTRCDLGTNFEMNLEDKQYVSAPIPKFPSESEQRALRANYAASAAQQTPTVLVEITTVDTGERRKMFGYEARHVITTRKHTRLSGSGSVPSENDSVMDGWYTDLSTELSCEPRPKGGGVAFVTVAALGSAPEVPSFKLVGKRESGFPLDMKIATSFDRTLPDGSKADARSTSERRVIELYSGPLDPKLFEIPPEFAKVDEIRRNPPIPLSDRVQMYWNTLKQRISRLFS